MKKKFSLEFFIRQTPIQFCFDLIIIHQVISVSWCGSVDNFAAFFFKISFNKLSEMCNSFEINNWKHVCLSFGIKYEHFRSIRCVSKPVHLIWLNKNQNKTQYCTACQQTTYFIAGINKMKTSDKKKISHKNKIISEFLQK